MTDNVPAHHTGECKTIQEILGRVGDKWSVLVIVKLAESPHRFNELKREIVGISQRMLTLTLRGLERDGLIKRTVYDTVPPSVEYKLTGLGQSLKKPVIMLAMWVVEYQKTIHQAREAYDKQKQSSSHEF